MTFKCERCNELFDDEKVRWEKNKVGTYGMYEEFATCPDCHDYIEEVQNEVSTLQDQ